MSAIDDHYSSLGSGPIDGPLAKRGYDLAESLYHGGGLDMQHTAGPWELKRHRLHAPQLKSNALLIAAAPDLLAALRAMVEVARYYHNIDECECPDCCGHCLAMRKVDTAIAKATGDDA